MVDTVWNERIIALCEARFTSLLGGTYIEISTLISSIRIPWHRRMLMEDGTENKYICIISYYESELPDVCRIVVKRLISFKKTTPVLIIFCVCIFQTHKKRTQGISRFITIIYGSQKCCSMSGAQHWAQWKSV